MFPVEVGLGDLHMIIINVKESTLRATLLHSKEENTILEILIKGI